MEGLMVMVTDSEAGTRWCPAARAIVAKVEGPDGTIGGLMGNRGGPEDGPMLSHTRCIGARCMAWRIGRQASPKKLADYGHKGASTPRRGATVPALYEWDHEIRCWVEPQAEADKRSLGYCGLAGAVQP
jgi:hypothetical protein